MKKILLLSILAFGIFCIPISPQDQPQFDFYTLPNGMKVFLQHKPSVPLVHACLAIGLGVKNEDDQTSGQVHLLEHLLLFGSTEKRPAARKTEDMRRLGGYFNAHTDHDLMTVEMSLPADAAAMVPEWMREFVFSPAFITEEIEGEKKIIQEEIRQIGDNPDTFSTDMVMQQLFASHPYGRPIYGRPEVIAVASADQLRKLHQAYVVPGNCALALVGRFDLETMKKRTGEVFADLKNTSPPVLSFIQAKAPEKKVELKKEMDVGRAHLKIGFFAPHFNHADRTAMSILTHLLGRGRNPLLFQAFTLPRDMVDSLDVRFLSLKYGGIVLIHVIAKPGNLKRLKSGLLSFLGRVTSFSFGKEDFLPDEQFMVTDYLQGGKNLLLLGAENAKEEGSRLAVSYATFLLLNEQPLSEAFADKVNKVRSGDLRTVCSRYLAGKAYVAVEIDPLPKDKNDEKKDR